MTTNMETNSPTSAMPLTAEIDNTTEAGRVSTKKVKIHDYGYETAGLNRGESAALKAHLGWIKEGHIVDEGYSEQEHLLGKKKVENNIQEREQERQKKESEKETIADIKIPAVREKIEETNQEIRQVKIDVAEKRIATDFGYVN